jgi:tRNA-dihydrouridine synthase A
LKDRQNIVTPVSDHPLSVAPMLDWTDRHCRYFLRLVSPRVRLYTEMITTAALRHGDRQRLLEHDLSEHPVAVQLGGSDPRELAMCARWAEASGYAEVNLNLGCPSDRVQSGRFGACLMLEPARVAECVRAMREVVSVPVTVKCRTGVDEQDSYEQLHYFVGSLVDAGLERLIVHARKAWLQGLSPKQNRDIPPLHYERVYRLKADFPALTVDVNGGIGTTAAVRDHLRRVDGVMIGRRAYHDPWLLASLEEVLRPGTTGLLSRHQVAEAMLPYIERELTGGTRLAQITRHMLGLFHARPGGKRWRRYLSEHGHRAGAGPEVVREALERVPDMDRGQRNCD